MSRMIYSTLVVAAMAAASTVTSASDLPLDRLMGAYNNKVSLDALTESEETMNRVDLLHLGRNSLPRRLELIAGAKHHIFTTIPYWFDDITGNQVMEAVRGRKLELADQNQRLDFRVLTDWVSPASSGDFWGTKQFKRLEQVADGKLIEWNPFWRLRPWSQEIARNRMHDKLFVVDGKTLIMGGMNVADEYLQGGSTSKGWHDTDIMVEGPAAQRASKLFLKPYLMQKALDEGASFPYDERFALAIFRSIFNFDNYSYEYPVDGAFRAYFRKTFSLPMNRFVDNAEYFPELPWKNTYTKPVRLIWDQPLVDRKPVTHKHFSKLLNVMDFILPQTRESLKIFLPYPTFSDRMMDFLLRARARGLKVQLLTNSIISHDLGIYPYLAGLVNYERLLKAGVEIHEWQGHAPLKDFEKRNECAIDGYWPGHTLHTKAVLFDDSVAMIGSNNFNYRSEKMNSEVMALVRDSSFARELADVFRYDLDRTSDIPGGVRQISCGGKIFPGRPPRTKQMTLETFKSLKKKYAVTSKLLDKLKWAF